jgi:hypothetical protein
MSLLNDQWTGAQDIKLFKPYVFLGFNYQGDFDTPCFFTANLSFYPTGFQRINYIPSLDHMPALGGLGDFG